MKNKKRLATIAFAALTTLTTGCVIIAPETINYHYGNTTTKEKTLTHKGIKNIAPADTLTNTRNEFNK